MQQLEPPIQRLSNTSRIVVVRDGVDELDRTSRPAQGPERIGERSRIQTLLIHCDMDDLALIGAENPERADIAGRFTQHHVSGIAEDAGKKVEALLRPDGD